VNWRRGFSRRKDGPVLMNKKTGNRNLIESFNRAFNGIIYCFRTQRNLRIHLYMAVIVLFLSLWLHITKEEMLLLFFAIALVLITEMINTGLEVTIDLITDKYHPLAAVAKDVAAGGVLVAAITALITGYIVFFPRLNPLIPKVIEIVRDSPAHLTIIALGLVLLTVIIFKARLGKGHPFSGGMPSGHTALGFALSTAIILISGDGLVGTLGLILSLLLAQSRLESGIHSGFEILVGGILGVLLTFLIFQLYTQLG